MWISRKRGTAGKRGDRKRREGGKGVVSRKECAAYSSRGTTGKGRQQGEKGAKRKEGQQEKRDSRKRE